MKKMKCSQHRVEVNPHLGRVIDDEGNEITLPRKTDELDRVLSIENPNQLKGKACILTKDSTWRYKVPKPSP